MRDMRVTDIIFGTFLAIAILAAILLVVGSCLGSSAVKEGAIMCY